VNPKAPVHWEVDRWDCDRTGKDSKFCRWTRGNILVFVAPGRHSDWTARLHLLDMGAPARARKAVSDDIFDRYEFGSVFGKVIYSTRAHGRYVVVVSNAFRFPTAGKMLRAHVDKVIPPRPR
jgi:hypothetical protein